MLKANQIVSGLELWQWRKTAIQTAIASDISPMEVDWLLLTIQFILFVKRKQIKIYLINLSY